MTGYRRVLTCGEPCAEDFECINCIIDTDGGAAGTAGFCTAVTGSTVCPSTLSVAVSAPAITSLIMCDDVCQTFVEYPAVDVTIAVARSATSNCQYSGSSGIISTATYYPCSPSAPYTRDVAVTMIIEASYFIPFTSHQPCIITPCTTSSYCEAYVIGVFYSSGGEVYGWATTFEGNDAESCDGTSRCYTEYGELTPVVSSWKQCTGSTSCCGGNGCKAVLCGNLDTTPDCTGGSVCSLPTGFTIGRPT